MNKIKQYTKVVLLAVLPIALLSLMTACSDDDSPSGPSKVITQVDVYKSGDGTYEIHSRYNFTYDSRKRVSGVRTSFYNQEVSYTYGTNSVAYRWDGEDEDGTVFINRFEATLESGRVNIGRASVGNYVYFYNNKGYIREASIGADKSMTYDWGKSSLIVESSPSTYDTEYNYSHVLNSYSFDLNILPQLVDGRENFVQIMNTYGQLAGVLGTRYPYFLEDTDFAYSYKYDSKGRLVQIEQTPAGNVPDKQEAYWFMLKYQD